jgi:hypothetical protein
MGMPFWDLKPLIDAGGIQRSNVIYALHYYYTYDGAYPASNSQVERDYWAGNLATAKAELYSDFLGDTGIQDAQNAGKTVWFEALGTNTSNPNANVFAQDAVNFCKQYGISFIISGASNSDNWPWIFNTDGTLNSIGSIMLGAPLEANTEIYTVAAAVIGITATTGAFGLALRRKRNSQKRNSNLV